MLIQRGIPVTLPILAEARLVDTVLTNSFMDFYPYFRPFTRAILSSTHTIMRLLWFSWFSNLQLLVVRTIYPENSSLNSVTIFVTIKTNNILWSVEYWLGIGTVFIIAVSINSVFLRWIFYVLFLYIFFSVI